MKNQSVVYIKDENSQKSVLTEIFELHAIESITDEQIMRVLEPVFRMIMEGKFDKRKRKIFSCYATKYSILFT